MGNTTATTIVGSGAFNTVSYDDIIRVVEELNKAPKLDQWLLVDPQGCGYKGTVEQIALVILREHPLLKFKPSAL
jgi:hypothetical protein